MRKQEITNGTGMPQLPQYLYVKQECLVVLFDAETYLILNIA